MIGTTTPPVRLSAAAVPIRSWTLIVLAVSLAACGAPLEVDDLDAGPDGSRADAARVLDADTRDAAEPTDASALDAPVWDGSAAESDAGAIDLDAAANDAGAEDDAGMGSLEDAGAPDAGAAELDGGTSDLDAGSIDFDAGDLDAGSMDDAGAMEADAGPPDAGISEPDAGFDAGPPDAGYDAGPPPCLSDLWEPNDTVATARLLTTCVTNACALNIEPTFSGADADWFRIDVRRTTTRPTHVRVSAPPGVTAWLRIRYACDSGTPTCSAGAARISNYCEIVGYPLGAPVDLTVSCPDLSGPATFYVEATRPSLDACVYSPTFELDPG